MQTVAAVTMVRDDAFFLRAWLAHYGEMFGRQNCYVINHGYGARWPSRRRGATSSASRVIRTRILTSSVGDCSTIWWAVCANTNAM